MSPRQNPTQAVLKAAERLIRAYGASDIQAYLSCFALNATFDFYMNASGIESLAELAEMLGQMAAAGVRVLSCTSTNPRVEMLGDDVAIFRHDVVTVEQDGDEVTTLYERETIVFRRGGGYWLAVHEHLSERPSPE